MQPFGRAVWRHGRIGLELAARPAAKPSFSLSLSPARTPSTACIRCHVPIAAFPARFYSSQPSSDADKPPNPPQSVPKPDRPASTANNASAESAPSWSKPSWLELPSISEERRSALNKRFSTIMDNVQTKVLNASQKLNEITGYTGIEAIKVENEQLEHSLAEAQARVRAARQAYKTSNNKRASTQREVTTLLARKDTWSPADLERFTELYRTDHVLEGEVVAAQENLTEAESDEQKLSQKLSAGILKRYHEEQIWSDRIRRASTWGTWGLMGMNFILFVVLQFVAEPWKRKRLVKGVVAEEKRVLDDVQSELAVIKASVNQMVAAAAAAEAAKNVVPDKEAERLINLDKIKAAWHYTVSGAWILSFDEVKQLLRQWKALVTDVKVWRAGFEDLISERQLDMRMRDASALVLEGLVSGIAIAWSMGALSARK
ncbi:Mdm33 family domain-containing protein [Trichoderma novae-zelandiae]